MLTYVNSLNQAQLKALKKSIIDSLDATEDHSIEDIKQELAENYAEAHKTVILPGADDNIDVDSETLWQKVKSFICQNIDENSEQEVILDIILAGLAMVMPMGAILLKIATWLLKKLINRGVNWFCQIQE